MLRHDFPDAIDTLKSRKNEKWYKEITKSLLTSYGNKSTTSVLVKAPFKD